MELLLSWTFCLDTSYPNFCLITQMSLVFPSQRTLFTTVPTLHPKPLLFVALLLPGVGSFLYVM